ncbi:MAG: MerR family transcriptional regulator [Caldilineaceae bacterium]
MLTSEVAQAVGVHPNTIRLYEAWGFLPPIPRTASGYRQFTEFHVDQMRLARLALCSPYPGGDGPVLALVRASALGHLGEALEHAYRYLVQVRAEYAQADTALILLERWAKGTPVDATQHHLRIGEVAKLLDISPDLLRDWERNRLLQVPRHPHNGYRQYSAKEIGRLRVIRMLRAAGYSLSAVLRLMHHLDQGRSDNLRAILDTPPPDEDIYYATDRWISTLKAQEQRALAVIDALEAMLRKYRS